MEYAIILSSAVIAVTVLLSFRQYYRSKERSILIEKGLDPSLLNIYSAGQGRKLFLYGGILCLGLAIGIIMGIILATIFKTPGETKEFILLSTLICLGISFFACYHLGHDKKS
jgi:hypothetical protein